MAAVATLLRDAEAANSAGRLSDAKAGYLDVLLREPGNATAALGLADAFYEIDDLEAAVAQYRAVLASGGSKAQIARAGAIAAARRAGLPEMNATAGD